jgi:hypothetical protein
MDIGGLLLIGGISEYAGTSGTARRAAIFRFESGDIKSSPDLDAWNKARAEESIKRYKLREHEPLMEARRDIWSKCMREVNRCQHLMNEVAANPTAAKREEVRQQMLKLRDMTRFEAAFSATACECLRTRGEQWAQRIASIAHAV